MKLWPTTTENKSFVKMLWYLLGECIKTTVLLVGSICTFFFNHRFVLFFLLYIKSRMRAQCFCTVHLQCHFIESLCLFFFFFYNKFWTVAIVPSCTVATVATVFIFFGLSFVLVFSFIYIVILTQQISQYFHNYWGVNFL